MQNTMECNVGESGVAADTRSKLSDAAIAAQHLGTSGWLFLADAEYCLQPHLGIQRFIEGSIVADRMTVAITSHGNAVAGSTFRAAVAAEATASAFASGKVVKLDQIAPAQSTSPADNIGTGSHWTVPMLALPPAVTHNLAAGAYTDLQQSGSGLDALAQHYSAGNAVMGYTVPLILGTRTLRELLLTDRFIAHWESKCAADNAVRSSACCPCKAKRSLQLLALQS